MAARVIYFEKDNILYQKRVDIPWGETDSIDRTEVSNSILNESAGIPHPCIDVSSSARHMKELSVYNVKDANGHPIKDLWDMLGRCKDSEYLPPGSYELIYIKNLTERQIMIILNTGSFYDVYYNPDTLKGSPAKACACVKLLAKQNKLDYVLNPNTFLWWYYANCSHPIMWDNKE